ncbi:MAG: ComEC/Rec2 family competence protein [Bacteroidia bacterium]|nr:ComEC/Rec2 family competence protein [Bacteroidia bacterium]
MFRWLPYAFVRLTLSFAAGITLAVVMPLPVGTLLVATVMAALGVTYLLLWYLGSNRPARHNTGWLALLFLVFTGYGYTCLRLETNSKHHITNIEGEIDAYELKLTGFPRQKPTVWLLEGEIVRVKTSAGWQGVEGKVNVSVPHTAERVQFAYGDRLLVKGMPAPVKAPANPNAFDYRKYLSFKNIFHQQFVSQQDIVLLSHGQPGLTMAAYQARMYCQRTLSKFIEGDQERAIALALVIGVTDEVDQDLMSAFSATGVLHVLAVSGLHVGILYMIILAIAAPFKRLKHGKLWIGIISLAALWFYAMVTGLSPSVMRAATMFSLLAVGKMMDRSSNVYNTLAVSAFVLLCIDPLMFMSVGFQLSYLAVAGIVYIHPRVHRLVEPSSWAARKAWEMTSVSMSAQLATVPLGLYYFHQFPVYFMLANLLVIPASFLVLVGGLLLLAVSSFGPAAAVLGWLLEQVIQFMNAVVFHLEMLPFSVMEVPDISVAQCLLLFLTLFSFIALFHFRKFQYLLAGVLSLTAFSALQWYQYWNMSRETHVTVYDIPRYAVLDIVRDGRCYTYMDTALSAQTSKIIRNVLPNRRAHYVREVLPLTEQPFVSQGGGACVATIGGQKILHLFDENHQLPSSGSYDVVIVSHNALKDVKRLQRKISFEMLVFDGSNSYQYIANTERQAGNAKIHSVRKAGAFTLTI